MAATITIVYGEWSPNEKTSSCVEKNALLKSGVGGQNEQTGWTPQKQPRSVEQHLIWSHYTWNLEAAISENTLSGHIIKSLVLKVSVRPLWSKVETLRGSFGMRSLPLRFWDGCFGRYPSAEPFEPLFSEIYGTVTLENRAAECSVTAHLAGFGKCCSGFVHRKILTRWFLCLFVCSYVCMVPVYVKLKSPCNCKLYWYYDFLSHAWIGEFYGNNIVLPNWVKLDNDQGS